MDIIQQLEKEQAEKLAAARPIPDFEPGDTVQVNVKVVEGDRTRVQAYEGVCIARNGGGLLIQTARLDQTVIAALGDERVGLLDPEPGHRPPPRPRPVSEFGRRSPRELSPDAERGPRRGPCPQQHCEQFGIAEHVSALVA